MDDPVEVALRRRRIRRCASRSRSLARRFGQSPADACVSAGNTGALMALSRYLLKTTTASTGRRSPTPCPTRATPSRRCSTSVRNVDCTPEHLLQFALMGSARWRPVEGTPIRASGCSTSARRRSRAARRPSRRPNCCAAPPNAARPAQLPRQRRGQRHLRPGTTDVVVRDGFVGNAFSSRPKGWPPCSPSSSARSSRALRTRSWRRSSRFRCSGTSRSGSTRGALQRRRPARPAGLVFKSHGSADAFAFEHALHRAYDAARNGLLERVHARIHDTLRPCRPRRPWARRRPTRT